MSKSKTHNLPYRPCVGIALFNDENHVFVGERIDNPGAWQMPQGGIDDGETVEDAFFREMEEEIGSTLAEIIKIHDTPLRYDLPDHLMGKLWGGQYGGQEQTWVAARFMGVDSDINILSHRQPEFQRWQWSPVDQVLDLIVPFKRKTYEDVIRAFRDIFTEAP